VPQWGQSLPGISLLQWGHSIMEISSFWRFALEKG
jgi:hypothetical protein